MRLRIIVVLLLTLGTSSFTTWSLSLGQGDQSKSANPSAATPLRAVAGSSLPVIDRGKLTPLQQQIYLATRGGAEWLRRANRTDGRFDNGYVSALKCPLDGDHFLRQAGAAWALARAGRFLGDERLIAVARQAVLTLLAETGSDPQDSRVRHTQLPSLVVNRLASAGLLVLVINDLPEPGADILAASEELCAFIRQQQRADGSLSYSDGGTDSKASIIDPEGLQHYPGLALHGLMRSQRHHPAPWKTDVVRRALGYYRPLWRAQRHTGFAASQTAAYAEAFLLTKEQPFADLVLEMNDWLCDRQYRQLDPRHPLWIGGFQEGPKDRPSIGLPRVTSAACAESLAEACRVVRVTGDLARFARYRETIELCLQFLTTLQYTEANTQHFADWYRPVLQGGFYASHEDGNLRIDFTQQAVCAFVQYLGESSQ